MKPLYVKKNGVVYRVSGTGIPSIYPAANVEYDNTVTSELQATDVQDAIDELSTRQGGVQSDWDEDDTTELSYIQNKPNLGTAAFKDVPASGDAGFTQVVLGKDTRLTYYDRNRYDASVKCSTNIVEGNIIVGLNGLYHHLNDGTVFDITYPILYAKNNMAAGAANKSNYDSLAIDITITQQMTLTQFLPVYIKGRLSGNMFNPISTTPLTQEMSQDGYHYMLLGLAGTTTNMYLFHDHRIFANNGGSFCELIGNLGTAAYKDIPVSGNANIYQVVTGNDTRLTNARPASDVSAWAKESTKPTYTASEVGAIATTVKGAVNGVAELDAAGKVPSSQLPSFVDDVIEVADYDHLPITGESGKIYVTLDTNKTYRWTGSGYVEISESLALGETSSTAYRGDRGKTAYDHATETKLSTATASGLYKVAATAQGHIASLTAVEKSDITALGIPAQDTTYGVVSKTANGLAPQLPNETTTTKYLRQDGTWQVPPDNNTTYTVATGDSNGQIKVTPSSGSAYNVGVKGLGSAAYANLANTVFEVGKAASRSTATVGTWTAMCNTTSTGSPKLPSASKWWNVMSLNNWSDSATNWVSQLGVPTQDVNGTAQDTVWYKHNDASGTNIDSSTWHSLASGAHVGNTCMKVKYTGSTTKLKININSATSWMLSFVVTIYQGYIARKFMISGYNNGTSYWHQPKAVLLGSTDNSTANVYFGYDSVWNLWVGFDGGSYTGLSITEVCNGYTQITDFNGLFTISNVSSLATIQTTTTATKTDAATVNGLTLSLVT